MGPDSIWLDTLWSGKAPPADTHILFILEGPDGWHWVREERPLFEQPDDDRYNNLVWAKDGLTQLQFMLPRPDGLAPGTYTVHLEARSGGADYVGAIVDVGTIDLPAEIATVGPNPSPKILFDNGVELSAVEILDPNVRPGHLFPIYSVWQSSAGLTNADLAYDLHLFNDSNDLVFESSGRPGADWLSVWEPDRLYRGNIAVTIPDSVEPGTFDVRWRLREGG